MLKKLVSALAMVAMASTAGANTLTADGFTAQGVPGTPAQHARLGLVNDGSFEFGTCDAGSAWTCTSTTAYSWILDPINIWGYSAYDGDLAAWLGGYYEGIASAQTFCQELYIDGLYLDWYWMGYISATPSGVVNVTVNGQIVWTHTMQASDHTYGTWNTASSYWGAVNLPCRQTATLCFENLPSSDNVTDNMLIDYVTVYGECYLATKTTSFSTVKALY
jgi:hypothetical protein